MFPSTSLSGGPSQPTPKLFSGNAGGQQQPKEPVKMPTANFSGIPQTK